VTALLEVRGVSRRFGGLQALKDVEFDLGSGEIGAVIGPNGAGKTTLLDVITGFTRPDSGTVTFDGHNMLGVPPYRWAARGVMRTFQSARIVGRLTVRENLLLGGHHFVRAGLLTDGLRLRRGRREERALNARADEVMKFLGLRDLAERPATGLPAGTQRLVEVGRILVGSPRLILLDEPAAGLDDSETLELAHVLRAIRESDVTMLLIEHNMELVMSISDRVLVLDAGQSIARGTPAEVSKDPAVIAAYLGDGQ
jgi:branched-chain amino acid transport system ATP-binding protein